MNETFQIEKRGTAKESIDLLEKFMLHELEPATEELEHVHTPGLYGRKWSSKAGTMCITAEHKVEHQFVILNGVVSVGIITPDGVVWEKEIYEAGKNGITKPGTRRIIYLWSDTTWMTFHPNPDNLGEKEFVDLVTEKHNNELFSEDDKNLLKSIRSEIQQKYLTE